MLRRHITPIAQPFAEPSAPEEDDSVRAVAPGDGAGWWSELFAMALVGLSIGLAILTIVGMTYALVT